MVTIRYSERIDKTTLLGPGNRAVLWVFGCIFDCKGCIAKNFRNGPYIDESVDNMVSWMIDTSSTEITISGGEPFLQAAQLHEFIKKVKEKIDLGVIVYTGFKHEELLENAEKDKAVRSFLNDIDVLIDGPYIEELNHDEPYRGSQNQRVICLTERYKDSLKSYYFEKSGRKIEIRIQNNKTLMIGVPSRDQAKIWEKIQKDTK